MWVGLLACNCTGIVEDVLMEKMGRSRCSGLSLKYRLFKILFI